MVFHTDFCIQIELINGKLRFKILSLNSCCFLYMSMQLKIQAVYIPVSYTHLDVYKRQVHGDNIISGWKLLKNTRTLLKSHREVRHISKLDKT